MIVALAAAVFFFGQQTLPSAPQPKATPNPFHVPANAPPPHSTPAPEPDASNTKTDQPDVGPVDRKLLAGPDGFAAREFFRFRLSPTIQRHWNALIPQIAKGKRTWYGTVKDGKRGTTYVTFTIHKDGSITDIVLEASSGDDQMDRAALQAVEESQPMPLWSSFKGDEIKIGTRFMYNPKQVPQSAR
jgi:TonB family protein